MLYKALRDLLRNKFIERFMHPEVYRILYRPTRSGFRAVFGQDAVTLPKLREIDVKHALRVAQTMIDFSRFENVSGVATELELPRETLREFSHSKIPDGIIQVTRGGKSYEIAIEVEISPKSSQKCEEFLDKYNDAFQRSVQCSGVIVVCDAIDIYERYLNHLSKRDESFRNRVLLVQGPGLHSLNPDVYGVAGTSPAKCGEKRRTHFSRVVSYFPIVSTEGSSNTVSVPPRRGSHTEISTNKEILQPIIQSGT